MWNNFAPLNSSGVERSPPTQPGGNRAEGSEAIVGQTAYGTGFRLSALCSFYTVCVHVCLYVCVVWRGPLGPTGSHINIWTIYIYIYTYIDTHTQRGKPDRWLSTLLINKMLNCTLKVIDKTSPAIFSWILGTITIRLSSFFGNGHVITSYHPPLLTMNIQYAYSCGSKCSSCASGQPVANTILILPVFTLGIWTNLNMMVSFGLDHAPSLLQTTLTTYFTVKWYCLSTFNNNGELLRMHQTH